MPSITKSISFMLLVGATTNVLAAPSRRSVGEIIEKVTNTGGGDLLSNTAEAASSLTNNVINTVPSFTASGNALGLPVCVVKDGENLYSMAGVATLIVNGRGLNPTGCTPEQTQECASKESEADKDAAKEMCPMINSCDPTEVAKVWADCMIQKCKREGKCHCNECDDEPKDQCEPGKKCCKKGGKCDQDDDEPKDQCKPGQKCCKKGTKCDQNGGGDDEPKDQCKPGQKCCKKGGKCDGGDDEPKEQCKPGQKCCKKGGKCDQDDEPKDECKRKKGGKCDDEEESKTCKSCPPSDTTPIETKKGISLEVPGVAAADVAA